MGVSRHARCILDAPHLSTFIPLVSAPCSWVCQGLEVESSDALLGPCRFNGTIDKDEEKLVPIRN